MEHKLYINGDYFETVEVPGFPSTITRCYQLTMPPKTSKDGKLCIAELTKLEFLDQTEYGYHITIPAELEQVIRVAKKMWDE